jgi:hypothetical protein
VGESYWREAVNLNFLVDEGVVDREDRELFWDAETAEETWNGILRWHDIPRLIENPGEFPCILRLNGFG